MSKSKYKDGLKKFKNRSNIIRLPNSRVCKRSEDNHLKVLRSCDLSMSNRGQLTQACTLGGAFYEGPKK